MIFFHIYLLRGKEHFNEILAINKVGFLTDYDDIRVRSILYSKLIFQVYDGMDYLGAALNEWFDHDKRKNFVLKKSNLVIGFFSLTWYRNMVKLKSF